MNAQLVMTIGRLKQSGVRMTNQRHMILHYLFNELSHPSAEELYRAMYAAHPREVSPTAVYNNLRTLKEMELVREFFIHDSRVARYDTNLAPHHHLVCSQCGSITDCRASAALPAQNFAAQGFRAESIYLEVSGLCRSCSASSRSLA